MLESRGSGHSGSESRCGLEGAGRERWFRRKLCPRQLWKKHRDGMISMVICKQGLPEFYESDKTRVGHSGSYHDYTSAPGTRNHHCIPVTFSKK